MPFLTILALFFAAENARALEVGILTPQGPRVLRQWSGDELKKMSRNGVLSSQELVFDRSTADLDLNVRADVDLVSLYGEGGRVARVPRFMIWRGSLRFRVSGDGALRSGISGNPLLVPEAFFFLEGIRRIELSRASNLYPGTKLQVRTNPAASRGEKIFTQSCMACHSLERSPKIEPTLLNESFLRGFAVRHRPTGGMVLDQRALRGLLAYREALASEKSVVNSSK